MSTTLSDIAKELGVSVSTVSRALNPETSQKVKPSTIAKINEAVKKLGYETNKQFLERIGSDHSIGIILTGNKSFSHYLFAEMLDHLQTSIHQTDYTIKYVISEENISKNKFTKIISSTPVSGAIILGPISYETYDIIEQNIEKLIYAGVNRTIDNIDQVVCNGANSISAIFEHFYSIGYRKIAYIGPTNKKTINNVIHSRFNSYINCLNSKNIEYNASLVQSAFDTSEEGYTAMYKILNSTNIPDAIICAGDNIAIGVIRASKENNVSIPEDIAIVGMDNIRMAQYLIPSLTTIDVPKKDLCSLAVKMLIDRIEGKSTEISYVEMPFDIIIRESCGYKLKNNPENKKND